MAVGRDWNPARPGAFRDPRLRSAQDLLAQVGDLPRGEVIDLGCGDGAAGPFLLSRFPTRCLVGVDRSQTMLANAVLRRCYERVEQADLAAWRPEQDPALIYSNAALSGLQDHATLIPRLARMLAPNGTLAVQLPLQGEAPAHRLPRDIAGAMFPGRPMPPTSPVLAAEDYVRLLSPLGQVRAWTTAYLQTLDPVPKGHPVRAFADSMAVRPYLAGLPRDKAEAYVAACDDALQRAYPVLPDGRVQFSFTQVFFILERT
jgi:trans-aconitate 2-methyltransferase